MSSSSGKGGSANQSKMVYGSGVIALSWGPWDWLSAVIHNGNFLFQGTLSLTTDVTDLTGGIADPSYLAPGGSLKLYRGTETQPADFTGRRNKGTVTLEAVHLLFGQDTGTAPNLQVIGGGLPRVSTSIVAAVDNVADDGQVNPVAAWAELLLDERGVGFDQAELDAPSWLASAHWAYLNRDYCFISPLFTEQSAARAIAKQLLDPHHGFCVRTKTGKLACRLYEWGIDPGGLTTLDARHFKRRPQIPLGDWEDVKTEIVVGFPDRDYQFQGNTVIVPNARAAQIRQVDDQGSLDRKHVMRRPQAQRHGQEYNRRMGTAPSKATLQLRRPVLDALGLLVGDKVKIDTDSEPGGAGLAQLCRIEGLRQDRSDVVEMTVVTDNLVPATSYTPDYTAPTPASDDSPPLQYFLGVPLPPVAFGLPRAVALLATRPSAAVAGFGAYFSDDAGGPYDQLGTQAGFAVRAQLAANITNSAGTLQLTELDGLSAPDASLAANTPGNATAAANNNLLAILAVLDGNGRIALDANGDPDMEIVSIQARSLVSGATHSYTVLRGRLGTTGKAWTTGAVAWIVPLANLFPWRHEMFDALAGSPAFFRLVSETATAVDDTIPVPECSVNMLPDSAPSVSTAISSKYAPLFIFKRSNAGTPALPSADATYDFGTRSLTGLNNGWSATIPAGTDPLYVSTATAFSSGATDTITSAEWAAVQLFAKNGDDGTGGANSAQVKIYQRSAGAPTLPSATATYTFATGGISGLNNGWSATIPAGSDPLYVAIATAFGSGATDNIASGEWASPVVLAQNGAAGSAGLNVASVFIYKRATSSPAVPSVDATFTFATGVLSGLNNGWTQAVPAGTDPVYVATAAAVSTGATDTISTGEWAAPQILAQNGLPGNDGAPGGNSAPVYIYQRSVGSPTLPSATTTYTFATGGLTGLNNGWTKDIPAGSNPLWVAVATAFGTGATDNIAAGEWSSPVKQSENGTAGGDGVNSASIFIFKRSASGAPALPSATTTWDFAAKTLSGLNNGWTTTWPSGTDPVYVSIATAASTSATDTIASGEWAAAELMVQNGTAGAAGGNSAQVTIYRRSAASPTLPSATTTYTFATGGLSGLNNSWTKDIPAGTDPLWASVATAFSTGATDTISSGEWATPQKIAENGTNGTNGATIIGNGGGGGTVNNTSYTDTSPPMLATFDSPGGNRLVQTSASQIVNAGSSAQTCSAGLFVDGTLVAEWIDHLAVGESGNFLLSATVNVAAGTGKEARVKFKGSGGGNVSGGTNITVL